MRRRCSMRPRLEPMEDRLALSGLTAAAPGLAHQLQVQAQAQAQAQFQSKLQATAQHASEAAAQRDTDASVSRTWRISNPEVHNAYGQPTAYKLIPTMATPTLFAHETSNVAQRAGFARHNLWVTPYSPHERRAGGEYPNQHPGGDGLPAWTAANRNLVNEDLVVWYSFGVTHTPRPEDWPVMPVEYSGFLLSPFGFFDRNPSLDVAPTEHCAHE